MRFFRKASGDPVTAHVVASLAEGFVRKALFLARQAFPSQGDVDALTAQVLGRLERDYGSLDLARIAAGVDQVSGVVQAAVDALSIAGRPTRNDGTAAWLPQPVAYRG